MINSSCLGSFAHDQFLLFLLGFRPFASASRPLRLSNLSPCKGAVGERQSLDNVQTQLSHRHEETVTQKRLQPDRDSNQGTVLPSSRFAMTSQLRTAVTQKSERVVHNPEGRRLESWLLQAAVSLGKMRLIRV
ncbi:unnamed protein product [Pleuronectes platessa]|uniref:Secreted protein n=1 Tax=Pleuronectes platessa TaxID=8262 RepID=A0A9N7UCQ3_PLEPL|nr:unnamed protein product [Pleuronectes platessa]